MLLIDIQEPRLSTLLVVAWASALHGTLTSKVNYVTSAGVHGAGTLFQPHLVAGNFET